ncbi:hypothetical protein M3Y96_00993000 [Aphelenchoides besseyi]|nr:hypothetical protein M3Y96_00993000 [Aphelenchoides besseyi]
MIMIYLRLYTTMLSQKIRLMTKMGVFCILIFTFGVVVIRNNETYQQIKPEVITTIEKFPNFLNCNCNGENFCFHGINYKGDVGLGKRFDCSLHAGLSRYKLTDEEIDSTPNDFDRLNPKTWQPMFVTSASDNHFSEVRMMVKNIKQFYPDSKIVLYDLGLEIDQVLEIRQWCNVEYKRFNFSKYPFYVGQLLTYAFKVLILEALQEYGTFFYFDSSIRITGRNMNEFLRAVKDRRLTPLSNHVATSHSVFSTTHMKMYDYLPLPFVVLQMTDFTSTMFVSDSPYTRKVLKWFYLCAMTKNCIAPKGAVRHCPLEKYATYYPSLYLNCHRFDQAYWNLYFLTYLFGEEKGAIELGYTKPWTELNSTIVRKVEASHLAAISSLTALIDIRRKDGIRKPIQFPCSYSLDR